MSFGKTRFNIIETINTTATQFCAKTVCTICGKILNKSSHCVNPSPTLSDNAAITIFLCENPHLLIICRPLTTIVPNIIIVQPPSTASGSVERMAPKAGNIPAIIIITAPVAMVNLFTTFVIATSPTFWLNDVIGRQPNTDESALTNPSHAIEPDVSFSVAYLSSPEEASAEVSPIVSVAETKNISTTDTIGIGSEFHFKRHKVWYCYNPHIT